MAELFEFLAMLATWVEPQHLPFLKLQALEASYGESKIDETENIRDEESEGKADVEARRPE